MKANLKIVYGTDIGGIPWQDPEAREFTRMVSFGMTPMDAIRSATSRPPEMFDRKGQIGVIAPGAYADVIAVSGYATSRTGKREICDERRCGLQGFTYQWSLSCQPIPSGLLHNGKLTLTREVSPEPV